MVIVFIFLTLSSEWVSESSKSTCEKMVQSITFVIEIIITLLRCVGLKKRSMGLFKNVTKIKKLNSQNLSFTPHVAVAYSITNVIICVIRNYYNNRLRLDYFRNKISIVASTTKYFWKEYLHTSSPLMAVWYIQVKYKISVSTDLLIPIDNMMICKKYYWHQRVNHFWHVQQHCHWLKFSVSLLSRVIRKQYCRLQKIRYFDKPNNFVFDTNFLSYILFQELLAKKYCHDVSVLTIPFLLSLTPRSNLFNFPN